MDDTGDSFGAGTFERRLREAFMRLGAALQHADGLGERRVRSQDIGRSSALPGQQPRLRERDPGLVGEHAQQEQRAGRWFAVSHDDDVPDEIVEGPERERLAPRLSDDRDRPAVCSQGDEILLQRIAGRGPAPRTRRKVPALAGEVHRGQAAVRERRDGGRREAEDALFVVALRHQRGEHENAVKLREMVSQIGFGPSHTTAIASDRHRHRAAVGRSGRQ